MNNRKRPWYHNPEARGAWFEHMDEGDVPEDIAYFTLHLRNPDSDLARRNRRRLTRLATFNIERKKNYQPIATGNPNDIIWPGAQFVTRNLIPFHLDGMGHWLILGETSTGKSTAADVVAACAIKKNPAGFAQGVSTRKATASI